jgi:hypothetical protein
MSITNYTDLQAALGNWLDHSLFAARYGDFIALFEATANRRLRTRAQESTATLTPAADGTVALPGDYLAWRAVTWTGPNRRDLAYVNPGYFEAAYPTRPSDIPRVFTIVGGALKVMPLDATPLAFDYFAGIPPLGPLNATNWLLASHPDLYLFGALVEAELFGVNDERAPTWKARRDEIFEEIVRLDAKTRGPSAVRVFGATP